MSENLRCIDMNSGKRFIHKICWMFFFFLIFSIQNGLCDTYYVRKDGSDINTGKENTPAGAFRTIQKAADIVKPGDTVLIQPGIYEEQVHLRTSGKLELPIVFKGEGAVVIEGESEIPSEDIKVGADGIMKIEIKGLSLKERKITLANVWLDGKELQAKNSLSDVQATKGTWFCGVDKEQQKVFLYINPAEGTSSEKPKVRIRRINCFSVAGDYNRLENLECRHAQTNIEGTGKYLVIDRCRVHSNFPSGDYMFYAGIFGPETWTVKNSEVYRCANNGIFLGGGSTVVGNKIYENKKVGLFLRVYKYSQLPVVRDNIFIDNPVAFTNYAADAEKKVVFEHNELIRNGVSFANGTFTIKDNIFRDTKNAINLVGSYGPTEGFIIHNLFIGCNPAINIPTPENIVFFSDENVFSQDTIVSKWRSQEMIGGSWMESSLAGTGDLKTWQRTTGQDSNSIIGNSLSEIEPSSVFIKRLTVKPLLRKDGLYLNFKGRLLSQSTIPASLNISITEPSGKQYFSQIAVDLSSDTEIDFSKDIKIPKVEGEIICSIKITNEKGEKIGRKFLSLNSPCAMKLELINPSYKSTIFSSQKDKQLRAKLNIRTDETDLSEWKVNAGIKTINEQTFIKQATLTPDREIPVSFSLTDIKPGSYELVVTVENSKGETLDRIKTTFHCLEAKPNTVRIDSNGNILVDEKPFFPIGVHGNTGSIEDMEIFSHAGFNVTTGFNTNRDFMDEAAKHGIKIILLNTIGLSLRNTSSKEEKEKLFLKAKEIVTGFKDHPALLCYLWGEEMGWSHELVALYQQTSAIDPFHPVAMNGSFKGGTSLYYISDIMMNHLYPYPLYGDSPETVAKKIGKTTDRCKNMIEIASGKTEESFPCPYLATGKKPWILWPQYFHGGRWARGSGYSGYGRFLNLIEMRNHVWGAIASGAKGILFWAYFHDYTNPRMNPKLWEVVRAIGGEVRSLEQVLVQPERQDTVRVDTDTGLSMTVRKYKDSLYVIAAYNGQQERKFTFTLADRKVSQMYVWSEKRVIPVKGSSFTDLFRPMDVHIYTTKKPVPTVMEKLLADPFFATYLDYQPKQGNIAASANGAKVKTSRRYTWYPHENYAIDSDPDTCWFPVYDGKLSPSFKNPEGKNPEWIEVTFPKKEKINKIIVRSYTPKYYPDPNCALSDFDIEYWDGNAWKLIESIKGNTKETIVCDFPVITTDKIRLVVRRGLYLSELEAYSVSENP